MSASELKAQVRLYCILARKSPLAVVFRRGPSKRVLLIQWNTETDEFHEGQWFKGRIYERRCDLSPGGKRLIYFAATYKEPHFSWTAISKPPYLTAFALWPKGDGWGGGGLFKKENEIILNHRSAEMKLAAGFELPRHLQVKPLGDSSGWGEDDPIMSIRLEREGWRLVQEGETIQHKLSAPVRMEFNPAYIWSKASRGRYELEMQFTGVSERDGPWYIIEHVVIDKRDGSTIELGRTDWADWSHSGDLLFAKAGKLFRLGCSDDGNLDELDRAKLLIDLNDRSFVNVAAPDEATHW
jgi:hypothetical protein